MADPIVTLRISADTKGVGSGVAQARKEIAGLGPAGQSAGTQAAAGFQRASDSAKSLQGGLMGARSAALALGASLVSLGSVRSLVSLADQYANITNQLRLATGGHQAMARAQEEVFAIAQRTRSDLESTANLYARITNATSEYGFEQERILRLTETINKAFIVSGASTVEQANAVQQLTQAFAGGVLRAEEFNTVVQSGQRVAKALADGLGVGIGELRRQVNDGTVTVERMVAALESQASAVGAEFGVMASTVEQAWTTARNEVLRWVGDSDVAKAAAQALAATISTLGKNMDTLAVMLGAVALAHVASAVHTALQDAAQRRAAVSAVAEAEAQVTKMRAMQALTPNVVALTAAELRLAEAQAAATAAGVGQAGVLSRLGSGLLSLAGGPIGVAVLAIGGLYAGYRALAKAEDERAARFQAGITATEATIRSIDELNAQVERARQNFDSLPNFAATVGTWSTAFDELAAKQQELNDKRAEIEAIEGRVAAAQRSTSEGASAALISLLPRLEQAREQYAALDDVVKRLSGSLDSLNFDQFFNPTAAQVAGDMAGQAFAQLTARAKEAETQIEKNKQGEIGYWQALAQTRIEQAKASGASAERVAAIQAENAELLKTIGSTMKKADSQRTADSSAKEAAKSAADFVKQLEQQVATYGLTGTAALSYEASTKSLTAAQREQASAMIATIAEWDRLADVNRKAADAIDSLRDMQANSADEIADLRAKLKGASAAQIEFNRAQREAAKAYAIAAAAMDPSALDAYVRAIEAAQEKLDLTEELDATEESAAALESILTRFDDIDAFDKLVGDIDKVKVALDSATDPAQIERLKRALGGLRQQTLEYATNALGEGITSLQSMATEGTRAYAALEVAQTALNLATAIGAIANQGMGDPYTAFARIAAMAALMSQLVDGINNIGNSGWSDTAARRQATQGTGTVLGDSDAKSESIARAVEITADATSQLVGINRGMLSALLNLQDALGAAGGLLARGAGEADFSGLDLTTSSQFIDVSRQLHNSLGLFDLAGIFKGKSKITDQGIVIMGGALSELLENIAVGAYQEVQSRSWAFGSTHTRTGVVDVSDEFSRQFELVIASIVDTVREGATALGLLPADIEERLAAFRVEEIKISLKGLSAEEQQKELEAVFSALFDDLAASVVPFVEQFQRVGEGLGETLVRIATQVQVAQAAFEQLGLAVSAEKLGPERFAQVADGLIQAAGGLEEFIAGMQSFVANFAPETHQFQVASDALASAFDQVGLAVPATRDGMWALMQSLNATTESGQEQIATLLRLADVADRYYSLLEQQVEEATEYLQSLGLANGAMSAFTRELLEIHESGERAAEAANTIARAQGRQGASAAQLARISQWTADQMAAAMRRLQEQTLDLIAELYGGVPGSLDAINARIAELEQSTGGIAGGIDDVAAAGENLFESWMRGVQSVQEYLDSMLLGDLSALTPEQQLAEARRQLEAMQAAALGGDADALASLPQLADTYLRLLRDFEASGSDYNAGFDWVRQLLQEAVGAPGPGMPNDPGGTGTVTLVPSDELRELYEARDAALAAQEAAYRAELAQQLAQNLHDLAVMLNVPLLEMIELQGISLAALAADLGVDLQNLTAGSVEALGNMAATLGVSLTELTGALGLQLTDLSGGLTELTARVGIDLQALTVESTQSLAALATSLGADLTELATAVGIDLGNLADSQSLLNQALAGEIGSLPAEQSALLAPLLNAITEATTEADANTAIAALEDAVNLLAPDIRTQLAPYLEGVFPADALSDLDYLSELRDIADEQLGFLAAIRDNLAEANRAAGVPSYAVGTGFVMGDQLANIHHGEAVVPASVNSWFRESGWAMRGAANDTVVVELRALRAEVAQLRSEAGNAAKDTQGVIAQTGERSDNRRDRAMEQLASRERSFR